MESQSVSKWPLGRVGWCALGMLLASALQAGIPEPGLRVYGTIAINGVPVTASDTGVSVEARRTPTGPAIARYAMGSLGAAGNFYSLILNAEASAPLDDGANVALGSSIHLVVVDGTGVRDQQVVNLTARASLLRLNFGSPDTDGDGLSDVFESAHFGSAIGGNPALDSDGDGRSNLQEFQQATNPLIADGRHPADRSPADDRITLSEITAYILAWKTGGTWPVEPVLTAPNIVDYITRGGALWRGGETYIFDNDPVTTAPLWWVNTPPVGSGSERKASVAGPSEMASGVVRTLPIAYRPNLTVKVALAVGPDPGVKAHAVVETPPSGWVARNVSHDGRWDASAGQIKWGPFFDSNPRTLSYEVVPPPQAVGRMDFAGRGSFDGYGASSAGPLRVWPVGRNPSSWLVARLDVPNKTVLEIHGEPGREYEVQEAAELGAWKAVGKVYPDADGMARLEVDGGSAARFYRSLQVE
jgi:hypothetical protein